MILAQKIRPNGGNRRALVFTGGVAGEVELTSDFSHIERLFRKRFLALRTCA
jgi:hypothetical protein